MSKLFRIGGATFKKPDILKNVPKILMPKINFKGIKLIKRDPFGNIIILKSALISLLGMFTYSRFNIINKLKVEGAEHLMDLPQKNVLFISNHQTYYADVIALFHIFCSAKWKLKNINLPIYLLNPKVNTYYVAAEETVKKSGFLPKIFSYAGAITVKRSWRQGGEDIKGNSDLRAPAKIKMALESGWVITFPQGTTKPLAPVRKGSAHLIREYKPIVVPVIIDGFRRAFDKKGLVYKKRGVMLSVKIMPPVEFGEDATIAEIQKFIEDNIIIRSTTPVTPPEPGYVHEPPVNTNQTEDSDEDSDDDLDDDYDESEPQNRRD